MFRLLLNLNFLAVDGTLWAKAVSELSKGIFNLFDSKIFARCSGRERKLQLIWHQTSAGLFIVQNKEFLESKQMLDQKVTGNRNDDILGKMENRSGGGDWLNETDVQS